MNRIVKILIGVVAVLVIVVGGGVVFLSMMDFNEYRGMIAEQAKAATGRDLVIAGDLKLEVSLNPAIAVEGVTFANAPWGSRPEMVTMKRFQAEVELLPILGGEVRVKRVVLSGLDVLVETDKEGRGNWVFATATTEAPAETPSEGGPATLPVVNLVQIEDVTVTYLDGVTGEKIALDLDSLEARADGLDSPLNVAMAGVFNGAAFDVAGTFGSFKQLLEGGEPFAVKLDAKVPGVGVGIDGAIAKPLEGKGLNLALAVDGKDLGPIGKAVGAALPPLPPFTVSGRLKDGGGGYSFDDLKVKIGASDISGRAAVFLAGARPSVDVALDSQLINLDELLPPAAEQAPPPKEEPKADGDGRVFPDDPLPLDGLQAANAKFAFRGAKILVKGLSVTDVAVNVSLEDGNLVVKPLKATVAGGGIDGAVSLDARKPVAALAVKLGARKLTVGQLLKDMKLTDILELRLDADVDIKGSGTSVRAIMAGLQGRTNVVGRDGQLNSDAVGTATTGLLDAMPWASDANANKINCVVSRFDIKKGVATSKALVFDTNGMSLLGEGQVNLADETIDMGVTPESKSVSLASLAIPIRIGGTFAEPSFGPDPVAIAKGAASTAVGLVSKPASLVGSLIGAAAGVAEEEEDPCVAALSGKKPAPAKKTTTTTTTTTQSPPPKKEEGGVLEGVGSALGGLFGSKKN